MRVKIPQLPPGAPSGTLTAKGKGDYLSVFTVRGSLPMTDGFHTHKGTFRNTTLKSPWTKLRRGMGGVF